MKRRKKRRKSSSSSGKRQCTSNTTDSESRPLDDNNRTMPYENKDDDAIDQADDTGNVNSSAKTLSPAKLSLFLKWETPCKVSYATDFVFLILKYFVIIKYCITKIFDDFLRNMIYRRIFLILSFWDLYRRFWVNSDNCKILIKHARRQ